MLNQAGFDKIMRQLLWAEAGQTATYLDNISTKHEEEKPPYTQFYNKDAKYMQHLRTFGEMDIVKSIVSKQELGKLSDRGLTCTFVGYSIKHGGDVKRFFNMKTKRIVHSRDIQWLNKLYAENENIKRKVPLYSTHLLDNSETGRESENENDENESQTLNVDVKLEKPINDQQKTQKETHMIRAPLPVSTAAGQKHKVVTTKYYRILQSTHHRTLALKSTRMVDPSTSPGRRHTVPLPSSGQPGVPSVPDTVAVPSCLALTIRRQLGCLGSEY